jgi:hypothetical protein
MFREKALLIAERLLPAFDTPTGIPLGIVNMENGVRINVVRILGFLQNTGYYILVFEMIFLFVLSLVLSLFQGKPESVVGQRRF